jgi:hypothetical protein
MDDLPRRHDLLNFQKESSTAMTQPEHTRQVAVAVLTVTLRHLIGRIYDKQKAIADTPKLIDEIVSILKNEFRG